MFFRFTVVRLIRKLRFLSATGDAQAEPFGGADHAADVDRRGMGRLAVARVAELVAHGHGEARCGVELERREGRLEVAAQRAPDVDALTAQAIGGELGLAPRHAVEARARVGHEDRYLL